MPDNKLDTTVRDEVRKQVTQKIIGWLIAGIIALLGFAIGGWWFYLKPKVDAYIASVAENQLTEILPLGAVIPFALDTCPDGWEDFKPAYGRFIRGIDKSGENIDTDGRRNVESIQDDLLENHQHLIPFNFHIWDIGEALDSSSTEGRNFSIEQVKTSNDGGSFETRPKNVALLYCKRIQASNP